MARRHQHYIDSNFLSTITPKEIFITIINWMKMYDNKSSLSTECFWIYVSLRHNFHNGFISNSDGGAKLLRVKRGGSLIFSDFRVINSFLVLCNATPRSSNLTPLIKYKKMRRNSDSTFLLFRLSTEKDQFSVLKEYCRCWHVLGPKDLFSYCRIQHYIDYGIKCSRWYFLTISVMVINKLH